MATPVGMAWSSLGGIFHSTLAQWLLAPSLIFGGCCSNAIALELATAENPHSGTLITFAQFLVVSLYGIRKQLTTSADPSREISRVVLVECLASYILTGERGRNIQRVVIVGPLDTARALRNELATELAGREVLSSDGHPPVETSDIPNSVNTDDYIIYLSNNGQNVWGTDDADSLDRADVIIDIAIPSMARILRANERRKTGWKRGLALRFKRPKIPIRVWIIQVILFFVTSLMNNLAFGYNVTLGVQIIFRSGGPAANVLLGYLLGKRYSLGQVLSVLLISLGVAAATLSAKIDQKKPVLQHVSSSSQTSTSSGSYAVGIFLLGVALLLSAAMGLAQEDAYNRYGRGHWEEGLFYLHFLSLPMFSVTADTLVQQIRVANASPHVELSVRSAVRQTSLIAMNFSLLPASPITPYPIYIGPRLLWILEKAYVWVDRLPSFSIPRFWIPLAINAITHLVCVAGVHRLTSQVSSLSVTVVLAVRKAVSLGVSIIFVQGNAGSPRLWGGAIAVLLGTIMYSFENKKRWNSNAKSVEQSSRKDL